MTQYVGQQRVLLRVIIVFPPSRSPPFLLTPELSQTCLLLHLRSLATVFAASASKNTLHKLNWTNKIIRAPPSPNLRLLLQQIHGINQKRHHAPSKHQRIREPRPPRAHLPQFTMDRPRQRRRRLPLLASRCPWPGMQQANPVPLDMAERRAVL